MDFIPIYEFHKCVNCYNGNYKVKTFSCWDQYLSMAFAQLAYRESLRDIEACPRAAQPKLYHIGIRGKVSRNTLRGLSILSTEDIQTLPVFTGFINRGIFYNTGEEQLPVQTPLFPISRQINRCSVRPDCHTGKLLRKKKTILPGYGEYDTTIRNSRSAWCF
jgi:hypothetical protein